MVSSYASRLGRSYIYRLRLSEGLPEIEGALASYMALNDLKKFRVNGHFIELSNNGLQIYEAPSIDDRQLELDLEYGTLKKTATGEVSTG